MYHACNVRQRDRSPPGLSPVTLIGTIHAEANVRGRAYTKQMDPLDTPDMSESGHPTRRELLAALLSTLPTIMIIYIPLGSSARTASVQSTPDNASNSSNPVARMSSVVAAAPLPRIAIDNSQYSALFLSGFISTAYPAPIPTGGRVVRPRRDSRRASPKTKAFSRAAQSIEKGISRIVRNAMNRSESATGNNSRALP